MRNHIDLKLVIPRIALKQARQLIVMLLVLIFQLVPASAQVPLEVAVPSTKNMPTALEIVNRIKGGFFGTIGSPVGGFSTRLKRFVEENGLDPGYVGRGIENGIAPVWLNDAIDRANNDFKSGKRTGPDLGSFYDSKGRFRLWTPSPSSPGGLRVLDSPLMELLPRSVAEKIKNSSRGLIDWGDEQDRIGTDFGDLPLVLAKPIQDQTYLERKNARMRFVMREGISLTVPSPVEMGKQAILRGKISGEVPSPITVTWWVDGKQSGEKTMKLPGFSIPLTFATSGPHRFKIVAVDGSGKERTRLIFIPVAFKVTTKVISSSIGGGRLSVLVDIKGGQGPYTITWASSDGQMFRANAGIGLFRQKFQNPDQNTVKWIDIIATDTKTGVIVPTRIDLESDVPIEMDLRAEKTTLNVDESGVLTFDIKGGEPEFKVELYIDGETARTRTTSNRSGQFSVSFEEAGTYRIAARVWSKNSLSSRKSLILTVTEPEAPTIDSADSQTGKSGSYVGALEGEFSGFDTWWSIGDGSFNLVVDGKIASGTFEGVANKKGKYASGMRYFDYVFKGSFSGTYDPEEEEIEAKITGNWTGDGKSDVIDDGYFKGRFFGGRFLGRWSIEGVGNRQQDFFYGDWEVKSRIPAVAEDEASE